MFKNDVGFDLFNEPISEEDEDDLDHTSQMNDNEMVKRQPSQSKKKKRGGKSAQK